MAADTAGGSAAGAAAAASNPAAVDDGPRLPHELIPAHIRDKGQAELRRALIRAAEGELAAVKHLFQSDPEQWSQEVLCARFMKRKLLAIVAADPAKPDRRPLLPLDVLCEAKVSASAQVFIKCSCEACGGGAVSHAGGCFYSVEDWAAHGRAVFGDACLPVLSEVQLSWQELLELLGRDSVPPDHLWWCLLCDEELPGAPLRCCDACQLACHGACYTRRYGQPLAPGADGRVLCISCQNPALQTLQELQAPKLGSKAGTARYTVPPLPHEVFRRETNPSHFSKGTYDFWGKNQANLMDALVLKKDSPEAAACAAAIAAAGAATTPAAAAAADGEGGEPDAAAAAGAPAAAAGDGGGGPSSRATHVLIAADPDGRLVAIDYEFGKMHKTHGENRKLWVVPLLEKLRMQLGDLLVATRPPLDQQQQQRQHWGEALAGCDRVLQLAVVRKGARPPAATDNATSRAAALAAANAATQAARRAAAAAAAAARGGAPAAVGTASAVRRPAEGAGRRPQQEQLPQGRRQRREQQQQQPVLQGGDLRAMLAAAGNSGRRRSASSDDDDGDDAAAAAGSDGDYQESGEEEEEQQAAGDSSDYDAEEGRRGKRRAKKAAGGRSSGGGGGGSKGGSRGGGRSSKGSSGAAKRRRS